ncbi:MAG: AraC family transcriptional regulator [Alistipes sp.]
MKPISNHKYLISSVKDQMWGVTVNTVGSQTIEAGYAAYPPPTGHPSGFYFDVDKGRILDSYQLLYITSGRGSFYGAEHERIAIGAGDMILLRPHQWHSYVPDPETGWHEYWIGFRGANIDNRFRNDFFDESREVYRVGVREEITSLYDKAIEVAESERASYQQYLAGIANLLLGMTMYYHSNDHFVSLDMVERIDRARHIMREERCGNVTPEEVAQRVNMSYSWFRKMFRDYTNISPARYMQELRLQEACTLLSSASMSIKEIAFHLNYGDASYFSNMFRRHLRMTPLEYRRRFGVGKATYEEDLE